MADIDTLRPEVKEALDWFVARRHFGTNGDGHLKTIRAELLRLQSTESRANEWQLRAEAAEAELAALKVRIFHGIVLDVDDLARGHAGLPSEWRGKCVRLVVEE